MQPATPLGGVLSNVDMSKQLQAAMMVEQIAKQAKTAADAFVVTCANYNRLNVSELRTHYRRVLASLDVFQEFIDEAQSSISTDAQANEAAIAAFQRANAIETSSEGS